MHALTHTQILFYTMLCNLGFHLDLLWFNTCFLQRWLYFRGELSEVMLDTPCDIVQFEVRRNQGQIMARTFMVCVTLSLTLHLSFLGLELFWKSNITWVPIAYSGPQDTVTLRGITQIFH